MKHAWLGALAVPVVAAGMSLGGSAQASPAVGPQAGQGAYARAGRPGGATAAMARFDDQKVSWQGCSAGADDADGQALDQAGAQCADITVPLSYARPGGKTMKIAISRLKATDAAHDAGPLIFNLGGPGIPNLTSVLGAQQAMGAPSAQFDLIGMDTRLTGRSTPIDCNWPAAWQPRSAGASRRSFDRMVALSRDLAARCAQRHGSVLPDAATADSARDMDVVRAALGARKLNYVGYSYGSYLGAVYTQLFARNAGRIVLDSAIDPAQPGLLGQQGRAAASEAALGQWAAWAAQHDSTYHLGATPHGVLFTVTRVYQASARHALRVGAYNVDDTVVAGLLIDPLSDDSDASNAQLATWVQVLEQAAADGSAQPAPDLAASLATLLTGAASAQHSGQTAIQCADAPVSRNPETYWRDIQAHRAAQPLFAPVFDSVSPCMFLPTSPAPPVRVRNSVPAMIVGSSGDINSGYAGQQAMHHALTGSRMITLAGVRTHGVYTLWGSACVDNTVNAYLSTGALPARDLTCTRTGQ
jgi:pimeloyl-ACP methyl ester carboxylesterase